MKTTFAILFSLLLAVTQVISAPAVADSSKLACACSGCQKSCCVRNNTPTSQPATPPIAASRAQMLFAVLVQAVAVTSKPSVSFSRSTPVSPFAAIAVPLFQRNCSYLI
jgi:hypothetical protein